ncbi:MAG TPA: carbamoyltransferase [Elusimicrobiales bacterium]|nr:carbamoyltransferase [Elusimicrobiales bacterium]
MSVKILGISAFYHDSAAAVIEDGAIIAAAQEERFTRKKHDPGFPSNAVKFCLDQSGFSLAELDAVVFYDKPLLKFERLLETYYAFAPRGIRSFVAAVPVWIKEKLFLKRLLREELAKAGDGAAGLKLLFTSHHLAHAASAFFPSPFEEAAVLTIDGVGEWATASISRGSGSSLKMLKEMKFPHSAGLLYSAFTYYLGFKVNSGEYKLMGLSPYGEPGSDRVKKYGGLIRREMAHVKADGSVWLNEKYFNYATGLTMTNDGEWERLLGLPRRLPESELSREHCDLALAVQQVTEEIVLNMAAEAKKLTGSGNLCLAGGVALNCVAAGKLQRSGLFKELWTQPAAGDAGGAPGAALAAYHLYFGGPRKPAAGSDGMQGSYLGPEFSDLDIQLAVKKHKAVSAHFADPDELCAAAAALLADGKVLGWFQGRMEWGPRALGNRSILGDARDEGMQRRLNLKIKLREGFRPFAPSVLWEYAKEYFDISAPSPYMLLTADVLEKRRNALPPGYHAGSVKEKLYFSRSDIPAVTHLDYSARLQTVHRDTNPRYWLLLEKFRQRTGCGLLVNTSFNVRGEPIVCTPSDAYACFMRTDMDFLVLGDRLLDKRAQPPWRETKNWKEEYGPD